MIIKLTPADAYGDGYAFYMNTDHLIGFQTKTNCCGRTYAEPATNILWTASGHTVGILVKETPDQILEMLKGAA